MNNMKYGHIAFWGKFEKQNGFNNYLIINKIVYETSTACKNPDRQIHG